MTPRMMLQTISNETGKAAEIYPDLIKLMDRANIPPDERAAVMQYLLYAIATGDRTIEPHAGGMIQ